MEGAEPSPSCLVSAHISHWDVKFAGNWDSALKGNSALRAHVARAAGIELAHNEGQYVIHFLWDMRKFYDSIKAHLLIPQLVGRGYPLEILVLGSLTHKSPRCLQVGNGYSDIINSCASSILAGCLQSCSWARGLLFELVQALRYVFLDRSAKNTSMIRHNLLRTRPASSCFMMQHSLAKQSKKAQPSWALPCLANRRTWQTTNPWES